MSHASVLEQIDIFADVSRSRLERISSICAERRYDTGAVIFHENTSSDELYIILKGEVEIQVNIEASGGEPAGLVTISKLRQGQCFGEVALVDQGIRSATARCAASDTRLLLIKRAELLTICQEDFELGFILMRNLASELALKIRQTDLRLRSRLIWKQAE